MGNNCSCFSKEEPAEITVDKKPGTRKEAAAPIEAPKPIAATPKEKWTISEVQLLQGSIRANLNRKHLQSDLNQLVIVEQPEEPDSVSVKGEAASLPELTPAAAAKLAKLPAFDYSIKMVGGDASGPRLLSDDSVYVGQWKNEGRFGRGICYTAQGGYMEGYWCNGLHLKGRMIYPSGDHYEGAYSHMKREGKGLFQDAEAKVSYEGEWLNDVKHGFGTEHLVDGSSYEGYFENDMKSGRGIFRWPDGPDAEGKIQKGAVYDGEFKENKIHGKGKYVWSDVKWYDGDWFEGAMHGKGKLVQEGKEYVGEFVKDKKHGFGTYKWEGNEYEGDWEDNKMHGKGWLSTKGKPKKYYAFEKNKRGAALEPPN